MESEFKADPEKYKRMCEPHPSREEADAAAREFMVAVGELRERYRIPELVVHFEMNIQTEEGGQLMSGGCGWGNQLRQAKLARKAADRELHHLGRLIETAAVVMPELWRALITDPSAQLNEED